jgi:hypothetical protein
MPFIGQSVSAGMSEHVAVDLELEASALTDAFNQPD